MYDIALDKLPNNSLDINVLTCLHFTLADAFCVAEKSKTISLHSEDLSRREWTLTLHLPVPSSKHFSHF